MEPETPNDLECGTWMACDELILRAIFGVGSRTIWVALLFGKHRHQNA